jgi:uncharacterized protein (TIGR02246 family)
MNKAQVKRTFVIAALALIGTSIVLGQKQSARRDQSSSVERAIRLLDNERIQAQIGADARALDRIYADDFIGVGPSGTVRTKSQVISDFTSGELKFKSITTDEVQVRVYGETAVETGRSTMVGQDKGKIVPQDTRFTRVWVKQEGRWRLVANHYSIRMAVQGSWIAYPIGQSPYLLTLHMCFASSAGSLIYGMAHSRQQSWNLCWIPKLQSMHSEANHLVVLLLAVVGLCLFGAVSTSMAQSSDEIAYFHVNRAKPGMTGQYETARKRHWIWHQKMQDRWSYHVWQIVSGEATGTYVVCSFSHSWKEVDESDQKVGGEEDDPAAKVEPYLDAEWESYYRYLPDLSVAPKSSFMPSDKLAVTRLVLKANQVERFIVAQSKIRQALARAGYQEPMRWCQLVSGGESPQFLLLVDRNNWAAYGQSPDDKLGVILEKAYGKARATSILRDAGRAVQSKYVETWQYRADLSFVAAAN